MRVHGLKDNVALLVLLQRQGTPPDSGEPALLVGNTHLLFNPKRGDIKARALAPGQSMCCCSHYRSSKSKHLFKAWSAEAMDTAIQH